MNYMIQDSLCTAVIRDTGAELRSFRRKNSIEFLWQADPAYWPKTAPTLFPYIGPAPSGGITIFGQTYSMPRHGLIRSCLFSPDSIFSDRITFSFYSDASDAASAAVYPFSFLYRITYLLENGCLQCLHQITNHGEVPMPFMIGFHPALNCPVLPGTSFEDYHLLFEYPEKLFPDQPASSVLPLNYKFFRHDAVLIEPVSSRYVCLFNQMEDCGIRFSFSNFHSLALWSPPEKNAPFFCLEPWNAYARSDFFKGKELTANTYIQYASPGETCEYAMSFLPLGF